VVGPIWCGGRLEMKRGDIVTVALPGAYEPRPALIIQSDFFVEHPSVTILPVTSELRDTPLFRVTINSTPETGLQKTSQVMVDKTHTVPRDKLGKLLGHLDENHNVVGQPHSRIISGIRVSVSACCRDTRTCYPYGATFQ
jgi:mRNA interferase MazF